MDSNELERIATQCRIDILEMVARAQSGHIGGSMSAIDVLAALYFGKDSQGTPFFSYDITNPHADARDYFILSKAHCSPAVYTILAEAGFFSKALLSSFRQIDAQLQGHVVRTVPGIETSGGGLGQGLSIALGIALVCQREKRPNRAWCMIGDGEMNGGQIWEAALAAVHFKVDNLVAIIDKNQVQMEGHTHEIMDLGDVAAKWAGFGWHVIEINGHEMKEIIPALEEAKNHKGQPTVIISNTIKGKGAGIAEGNPSYHGKPLPPDEMEKVLNKLRTHLASLNS